MEHGHANHLADDWSSTVYWYQKLPSPHLALQPADTRIPGRPGDAFPPLQDVELNAEMVAQKARAQARFEHWSALRQREIDKKILATREKSQRNVDNGSGS